MITPAALYRLAGAAALAGGALRILAAFAPFGDAMAREWLYSAIDVLLLLGLMGIYLGRAPRLGLLGLASFVVAAAALSFIGGPDADPFGFSTYEQGAAALAIAMVGLSIAWLRANERPLWAPLAWFASVVCFGVLQLLPVETSPAFADALAGALFGAGFAFAGLDLLLPKRAAAG